VRCDTDTQIGTVTSRDLPARVALEALNYLIELNERAHVRLRSGSHFHCRRGISRVLE
jgi:hypothetical protein